MDQIFFFGVFPLLFRKINRASPLVFRGFLRFVVVVVSPVFFWGGTVGLGNGGVRGKQR